MSSLAASDWLLSVPSERVSQTQVLFGGPLKVQAAQSCHMAVRNQDVLGFYQIMHHPQPTQQGLAEVQLLAKSELPTVKKALLWHAQRKVQPLRPSVKPGEQMPGSGSEQSPPWSRALHVRALTANDVDVVKTLRVGRQQQDFVRPIEETLAKQQAHEDFYLICLHEAVLGFFMLDRQFMPTAKSIQPRTLGLRSYFVDEHQQGMGIGRWACQALPDLIRRRYPRVQRVALTVNFRNKAAQQLYLKNGFRDSGEVDRTGNLGPKHVFVQDISKKNAVR